MSLFWSTSTKKTCIPIYIQKRLKKTHFFVRKNYQNMPRATNNMLNHLEETKTKIICKIEKDLKSKNHLAALTIFWSFFSFFFLKKKNIPSYSIISQEPNQTFSSRNDDDDKKSINSNMSDNYMHMFTSLDHVYEKKISNIKFL